MKLKINARMALWVIAGVLGGCGLAEPPPFTPERLGQIQKEQAAQTPLPELPPLPKPPEPGARIPTTLPTRTPPLQMGPAIPLTLQEVIHRAMVNNLDARVASYEASVDEARILEAKSRFDPIFFFNPQFSKQFQQTGLGGSLTPADVLQQQIESGIRQNLPDGGQIELRTRFTRQDIEANLFTPQVNPFYQNELTLQITQPLLRDFGGEVNRARITIARYDQRISQLEWRDRIEEALVTAEEAYWRLYQAAQNVAIQRRLLERSEETLEILSRRLVQDVSRVQFAQAFSAVASRRAELIRLQSQIGEFSDRIKRIMNDPDLPVVSPQTIVPADQPVLDPIQFALADQIQAALENRFDLMRDKLQILSTGVIVKAAKNNVLPQLNVVGSVGVQGLGADFDDALRSQKSDSLVVYSLGLAFEVPFGNRGPRAIYLRTLLQNQQAMVSYQRDVEQAALEVKQAMREIETAWNEIIATRHARFAAEDALLALEQRERQGEPLTPNFIQLKLDRQEVLAAAARAEALAIATYNIAIAQLERAKGTIMRYDNVIMAEEPGSPMLKQ